MRFARAVLAHENVDAPGEAEGARFVAKAREVTDGDLFQHRDGIAGRRGDVKPIHARARK